MSHRGVAPTGHPAPIRTVIDEALQRDDDLVSFRLFASMKRSTYASTGGPSSGSGDLSCGPTPGRGAIRPLLICRVTGKRLHMLCCNCFELVRGSRTATRAQLPQRVCQRAGSAISRWKTTSEGTVDSALNNSTTTTTAAASLATSQPVPSSCTFPSRATRKSSGACRARSDGHHCSGRAYGPGLYELQPPPGADSSSGSVARNPSSTVLESGRESSISSRAVRGSSPSMVGSSSAGS